MDLYRREVDMKLTESNKLLERAKDLIPMQSQTFSKSPAWFPQGAYPVYLKRGEGCEVEDVDGNKYLDFICGLGTITLGYRWWSVEMAIREQLKDGLIFSLPHPLEVEVSELLRDIIPCAEMVRFSKTGSEVTEAAVTLARAYTGREHIAQFGYHGWHPWYSIITDRNLGVPSLYLQFIHTFEYNKIETLEKILTDYKCACVIMEPMIYTPPEDCFLEKVKEITQKHGALLIFDEMVTGFRWNLGGAQKLFKVIPDLATFGKGMSNGMPLAALVGKYEIMKHLETDPIFFSTTFGGECLSLAAAKETIIKMRDFNTIQHCWDMGSLLEKELHILGLPTLGYPCRLTIQLPGETKETRSLFMQELAERGILMHSSGINLSFSHDTWEIGKLIQACSDSWRIVKNAIETESVLKQLKGQVIQPVFKRN